MPNLILFLNLKPLILNIKKNIILLTIFALHLIHIFNSKYIVEMQNIILSCFRFFMRNCNF